MSEHESINGFGQAAEPNGPIAETGAGVDTNASADDSAAVGAPEEALAGADDELAAVDQRSADRPGSTADLDRIADLPLNEQPDAYKHIHDDLQRSLAEIDEA